MHYTGTLESQTINGTLELGRSKFKYSADIWFKVDVFWHKMPKGGPEPVKVTEPTTQLNPDVGRMKPTHTSKWDQMVTQEGYILAVVTILLYGAYKAVEVWATKGMDPIIMPPFNHKIDSRYDYMHKA